MSEISELFDYSSFEDEDPSLLDGFHCIYEREVPIEIKQTETKLDDKEGEKIDSKIQQQVIRNCTLEAIKVKILIQGSDDSPASLRVELSCENDLFFYLSYSEEDKQFLSTKHTQNLLVSFSDYPNILIRMFNSCIREPHVYIAELFVSEISNGKYEGIFRFIQNMEYKYVELLRCVFNRCDESVIQRQLTYRYNSMKKKLLLLQGRVHEIINVLKTKNPSLLLQLQKAPSIGSSNVASISMKANRDIKNI